MLCKNDSHYSICHTEAVHTWRGGHASLAMRYVCPGPPAHLCSGRRDWCAAERRRAWKAQAGREHFQPQNTSLGSACGSQPQHVGLGEGGLGLDPAVPSQAFSSLSFPRLLGDGHIAPSCLFRVGLELWLCFTSPLGLAWRVVGCLGLSEGRALHSLSCGDGSLFPPAALGAARSIGAAHSDGKTASPKSCPSRYDCCTRVSAGD